MSSGEISFKDIKTIGLIGKTPSGWNKLLKVVSWNGGEPKYDIRDWGETPDGELRMTKGMTFKEYELRGLHNLLLDYYGTEKVEVDEEMIAAQEV